MTIGPVFWTPELVERARVMWADGLSCSAIGRDLNVSKNCIASVARRYGFPKRPSPIKTRDPNWKKKRYPEKPGRVRLREKALPGHASGPAGPGAIVGNTLPPLQILAPIKREPPEPAPAPIRPFKGKVEECAHIVSGERRHAIRCNEPTLPGKALCGVHQAICFRPMEPRRAATNPHGNPNFARLAVNGSGGSTVHPGTFEEIGIAHNPKYTASN